MSAHNTCYTKKGGNGREPSMSNGAARLVLGGLGACKNILRNPRIMSQEDRIVQRGMRYAERQQRERETIEAQAWLLAMWGRPWSGR